MGGPWGKDGWYDVGIMTGDFVFKFELNMKGGLNCNDSTNVEDVKWRTILPFVYKEGYAGDADGHFFRMDWCGFGGGNVAKDYNHGNPPSGFNYADFYYVVHDCDLEITYTKVGTALAIDWIWKCNTEGVYKGQSFDYHQGCTLLDASKVGIALASEFANCTITKASLSRSN